MICICIFAYLYKLQIIYRALGIYQLFEFEILIIYKLPPIFISHLLTLYLHKWKLARPKNRSLRLSNQLKPRILHLSRILSSQQNWHN